MLWCDLVVWVCCLIGLTSLQLVPLGRCPKKISAYDYDLTDIKGAFFWDYSGIGILGIDGDRVLLEHISFSE